MTDEQLVIRVREGEIGAFEELVKRYQRRLVSFAERMVGEDAQDVAQETFLAIYKNIGKIDVERKFSTYLFEIAKNRAISILRKRKTMQLNEEISYEEEYKDEYVAGLVEKLERKYRQVIRMYYFDDLSYEQIAAKLVLPVNTVRTHLKRAKEYLRKWMI